MAAIVTTIKERLRPAIEAYQVETQETDGADVMLDRGSDVGNSRVRTLSGSASEETERRCSRGLSSRSVQTGSSKLTGGYARVARVTTPCRQLAAITRDDVVRCVVVDASRDEVCVVWSSGVMDGASRSGLDGGLAVTAQHTGSAAADQTAMFGHWAGFTRRDGRGWHCLGKLC